MNAKIEKNGGKATVSSVAEGPSLYPRQPVAKRRAVSAVIALSYKNLLYVARELKLNGLMLVIDFYNSTKIPG